jgi:hypothetical protein
MAASPRRLLDAGDLQDRQRLTQLNVTGIKTK